MRIMEAYTTGWFGQRIALDVGVARDGRGSQFGMGERGEGKRE